MNWNNTEFDNSMPIIVQATERLAFSELIRDAKDILR